jgi:hypothetical protein
MNGKSIMNWELAMQMITQTHTLPRLRRRMAIACSIVLLSMPCQQLSPVQAQEKPSQKSPPQNPPGQSALQRLRNVFTKRPRLGPKVAEKWDFNDAFTPPGNKAPKSTENGSSRDELHCRAGEPPVAALMPGGNYGLTVQEQPIIFVEASQIAAQRVVLAFQTETGEDYRQAILPIPNLNQTSGGSGIWRFQLPTELGPLTLGTNYRWSLAFICGDYLEPSDPMLSGWVQRVESGPLAQQPKAQQLQSLSGQGYWYDVLKILDATGELAQ